jgi:arylsulfatase A-like enzyme
MGMPPNVVVIVSDNQGAWTLGCYGNREIRTPNIDRLAAEGAVFSRAMSVNPVCSPSRASLLTGLIPSQHGIHNWLGGEKPDAQVGPEAYCTISEFANLTQIMAESGYECGMTGKWHLGDSLRPQLGFGYWFCKPRGHTQTFYNDQAIWHGRIYREPRYYTDAITEHAVQFLRERKGGPFFLYIGYNGPYGLGEDMRKGHLNRWTEYYADKELGCFPREKLHPWLKGNRDIINTPTAIRGYAAAVSGVDDGVGVVMKTLSELGLKEDTLLVYTSDHGFCAGHHGMWGMADHSSPPHLFEENLHIPLIFSHPRSIAGDSRVDSSVCTYDFFPSLIDYLGLTDRLPREPFLPGRSFAAAVLGQSSAGGGGATFHEYETTRAIHTERWKLVKRHPTGPDELYDMRDDPGECMNLAGDPSYAAIEGELWRRLQEFFDRFANPRYDLWKGGVSKAGRKVPDRKLPDRKVPGKSATNT